MRDTQLAQVRDELARLASDFNALAQTLEAARRIGAAVNRALTLEHVPLEALQAMQAAEDPVQSTFGALGLAYAHGNAIPDAAETAARYGVALTSVAEYAASLRG